MPFPLKQRMTPFVPTGEVIGGVVVAIAVVVVVTGAIGFTNEHKLSEIFWFTKFLTLLSWGKLLGALQSALFDAMHLGIPKARLAVLNITLPNLMRTRFVFVYCC